MKKLWWAFAILLMVAMLCITELNFITAAAADTENMVNNAINDYQNGNIAVAKTNISLAVQNWHNCAPAADIFLYHDTVDSITVSLTCAKSTITNSPDDFLTECRKSKEQLSSLKEAQLPHIENVL